MTPGLITLTEFSDHVARSKVNFVHALSSLYVSWVDFLDVSHPVTSALQYSWIPGELRWLSDAEPLPCLADSWLAWDDAVLEVGDAVVGMVPMGETSGAEAAYTRFAAARDAIKNFDPTAASSC